MKQKRYDVSLKGGPLHNLVKPYTSEYDDMPLTFHDTEILQQFVLSNGRDAVLSSAPMLHTYIPTRLKDQDGNVIYFYSETRVGQRTLDLVQNEKAVHDDSPGAGEEVHATDNKEIQKVETGDNS